MTTSRAAVGVWIDARAAVIVRWDGRSAARSVVESTVPAHHRPCGGAAQRGATIHGAGGPRSAGESHRLEHIRAFLDEVHGSLPDHDDLLVLGDGPLVDRLGREVERADARRQTDRRLVVERSSPVSEAQLLARLRAFAGSPPRRHRPQPVPRRVVGRRTAVPPEGYEPLGE